MMRLAVALTLTLAALVIVAPASARSSYCSPTGDYCISAQRRSGAVYLRVGTFSFRGRVRICVRRQTPVCHSYTLRPRPHGLYEAKVRWYGHYPNQGNGTYHVAFLFGSTRLGPVLSFTV
jgi:cbb3-type cytochrome oxidase cytochrome c subunit